VKIDEDGRASKLIWSSILNHYVSNYFVHNKQINLTVNLATIIPLSCYPTH